MKPLIMRLQQPRAAMLMALLQRLMQKHPGGGGRQLLLLWQLKALQMRRCRRNAAAQGKQQWRDLQSELKCV